MENTMTNETLIAADQAASTPQSGFIDKLWTAYEQTFLGDGQWVTTEFVLFTLIVGIFVGAFLELVAVPAYKKHYEARTGEKIMGKKGMWLEFGSLAIPILFCAICMVAYNWPPG